MKRLGIIVLILIFLLVSGCFESGVGPEQGEMEGNITIADGTEPGKLQVTTLVAIYMVGSDLESESGYASQDILEILEGLPTNPEDMEVVLAYGGATAEGWKGMTIADLEDLRQDAGDGVMGNEAYHREVYTRANMGDKKSLETFLSYIRDNYESEKVLLIFWDHGDAYRGLCFDENHGYDKLEISELESALAASELHFDLIGFDACLMSTLELAKAVGPFADYMLASETIEPTHGWDYTTFVEYAAEHPEAPPEALGREIIDSYLENPAHVRPRTLSLLDLSKTDTVLKSFDTLAAGLESEIANPRAYCGLGASFTGARKFGVEPRQEAEISMDLKGFTLEVREEVPHLSEDADHLLETLDSFVVYARHDGSVPGAHGISIYSPHATESNYRQYREVSVSDTWYGFLEEYMDRACTDLTEPGISKSGDSFTVEDDSGVTSVEQVYFINSARGAVLLGKLPAACSGDSAYCLPEWDGKWVYFRDNQSGAYTLVSATYEGESEDGTRIFSTELELRRNGKARNCLAYLYLEPENGTVDTYLNPYENLENGDILFSREVLSPQGGDALTAYAPLYGNEGTRKWISLETISVGEDAAFVFDYLPEGTYYTALYARDFGSNFNMSEAVEVVTD
ncbi:clostripain-related cysteine peptidase [Methanosarcina sp. Mfa9]|uniref:clostripain-related cysteine peptidase n=1 Tax=Methanosarcina sp. Mfa9 TaxID=3439063 RepID=UPI003F872832